MNINRLRQALFALALTAIYPSQAADTANQQQEPAAYLKLQDKLKTSDAVTPPTIDVAPVATLYNREAIIPPQCYTRTEGVHNPCYVCHQDARSDRENVMNDKELQTAYSFSDLGETNHWNNLFEDRSVRANAIADEAILNWVDQDNYSELAPRLQEAEFKGWIPDLAGLETGAEAFDDYGFARDGSHWVAFNYKPFPSTFWPTNGSTDDVMIRLPADYRNTSKGQYSADIYRANLAILEANIKGLDAIGTPSINEREVGVDLNGDGELGNIQRITRVDHYVGAATELYLDTYLYPQHTEFLHTVRYLDFDDEGRVKVSRRMKEVRYLKKWQAYSKATMARFYQEEGFEKEAGHLPGYTNLGDHGLDNGSGWSVQGFIENANGRLRSNSFEETFACMGCHSSVGSTIDKTFSFARKIDGAAGWGYIDLIGMPDAPTRGESQGEYLTYFERAGGGDEFRSNPEMRARWFNSDGSVNTAAIAGKDVHSLITPSRQRALQLNKAYRVIVEDQSFLFGRDATMSAPANVYHSVNNADAPTLPAENTYDWDIRLDWQSPVSKLTTSAIAPERISATKLKH